MSITITKRGRRHYIEGAPYEARHALKEAGCRWDPEHRAWWTGKADRAAELVKRLAGREAKPPSHAIEKSDRVIAGRATYKGKSYLLLFEGETRRGRGVKLAFRDGSKTFWAKDLEDVTITRRYQKRRSLAELESYAKAAKTGDICAECGTAGTFGEAPDSSGIVDRVCIRCYGMSRWERSYA